MEESVQISFMETPNAGDFQMIASAPSPHQAETVQKHSSSLSPEERPFGSVDQPVVLVCLVEVRMKSSMCMLSIL